MKRIKKILIAICLGVIALILGTNYASAQSSEVSTRTCLAVEKRLYKNLELSLSPEIRLTDQFSVDEYLIETGLEYKPIKYVSIGAKYRFTSNQRETKSTEYFNQFAFEAKGKYKINNLGFQIRTRYTNYTELDSENNYSNPYVRYRFKTEYELKNWNLTPFLAVELFNQLADKKINKIRYSTGLEYKINKHNQISLEYMYQDYIAKKKSKNIIGIQYKFKF